MGAWIETNITINEVVNTKSHPVWVRGLKLNRLGVQCGAKKSHPVWVRGLKPDLHAMV